MRFLWRCNVASIFKLTPLNSTLTPGQYQVEVRFIRANVGYFETTSFFKEAPKFLVLEIVLHNSFVTAFQNFKCVLCNLSSNSELFMIRGRCGNENRSLPSQYSRNFEYNIL